MLKLQGDIYSSLDQELGRRYAYAIDHSAKADTQLRQAADLLRSWDGVINADSPAAAVITAARQAFWPTVLKPRLGDDWRLYSWGEKAFAEEEIVTHSPAQWLPPGYANWDEFLTAIMKQGLADEHAPSRPQDLAVRPDSQDRPRASALRNAALVQVLDRNRLTTPLRRRHHR